jgi:hypothetical protein
MKTEEKGGEDLIFGLLALILEANRGRYHGVIRGSQAGLLLRACAAP